MFDGKGMTRMDAQVEWSRREKPIECHSVAEIDRLLDRAHAENSSKAPLLAVVTYRGYGVCVGLGIDPTVVEIHYPPCDGEYYTSTAKDGTSEELVDFFNRQGHYQYRRNAFVPLDEARQAVREFLETGYLTERIHWRDCWGKNAEQKVAPDCGGMT